MCKLIQPVNVIEIVLGIVRKKITLGKYGLYEFHRIFFECRSIV